MTSEPSVDVEAVRTAIAEEPPETRRARQRVVALIKSVESHCVVADEALATFEDTLGGVDGDGDRPPREELEELAEAAAEACEHVSSPCGPLEEALTKLLVEPRPDLVSPALTRERAAAMVGRIEGTAGELSATVGPFPQQLREATDPSTRRALARRARSARGTVTTIDDLASDLRRHVSELFHDGHVNGLQTALIGPEEPEDDTQETDVAHTAMSAMPDIEAELADAVVEELRPEPRLTELRIDRTGLDGLQERADPLAEIMASPTIERPMWSELADLDQEYFLPGVGDIPADSVGLLETNTAAIESYILGLNHEFAETLRWRRYPTDLRGTYFRQFWNHRIDPETDDDPETSADVQKLHEWTGNLGSNQAGADRDTLVLLIKGELLRRYPNTVIYAAKAISSDGAESTTPHDEDRIPAVPESAVDKTGDSKDRLFPEFSGTLDPDITFFGFDLDEQQARYATDAAEENPTNDDPSEDDAGWFFVLEEPPAEARFGLQDVSEEPDPLAPPGEYVTLSDPPSWMGEELSEHVYYGEEPTPAWDHNSAHMADITWRTPVRVAIHASEMLPEE